MRDNAAMRDAPSPSIPPAGKAASRATRRDDERGAWAALHRGLRRRRRRAAMVIAAAAIAHLAVAGAVLSGFLGASHGLEPAAKAHAVVALLQTTRIARDGKHADARHSAENPAEDTEKPREREAFQPLLIAPPPPQNAAVAQSAQAPHPSSGPVRPSKHAGRAHAVNADADGAPAHGAAAAAPSDSSVAHSPRSAEDIEASAARLALAAGVTAASASAQAAPASPGSATSSAQEGARGAAAASAAATAATAGTAASRTASAPGGAPAPAGVPPGNTTPGAAQKGVRFALMPSSDLVYDTFYNGAQNQSGTLHWRTDGQHYSLLVSMPVPFIGTFSYHSEGHIDDYGIAPDTYTETRGRRGESVSRFVRDGGAPHVSFTRSPNDVPLAAGTQDRFSMIFQLASLVRADPSRYTPGVTRAFDVIDSNSAETWPIQTIGPDQTLLGNRQVATLHFMRLPRKPGDKRRIDVWLAPSMNWIPVRIMQTEPNGTQIELVFHARLSPAGSPAAGNDAASDATHDAVDDRDAATAAVSAHQDGP
ncbi:DUF3108 domain-containing protein [Robbsia sp. KACC 23696]|uniref:DUF3108 domain-containing protein n=1 Tax=Robbsia sp. KACC 23696 TaxID=3149231 RepID=UPI00325C0E41